MNHVYGVRAAGLVGGALMTRITGVGVVLIIALIIGATSVFSADPARLVSRGPTDNRTISLTFDDGSNPERCQRIYDTLVQYDIPATWFPNAVYMASAPSLWRKIAKRFPIANHTTHHRSLASASKKQIREEITSHERRVKAITGMPVSKLLRPPYGAWDAQVLREAGRLGYSQVVLWDVSSADTSPRGTDRGVTKAAMRGGPGSIILMHCGPAVTPRILPVVIARYACKGFRFATTEKLLAGGAGVKAKGVECPPPKLPARGKKAKTVKQTETETGSAAPTRPATTSPLSAEVQDRSWRLTDAATEDGLVAVPSDVVLTLRFENKKVSGTLDCDVFTVALKEKPSGAMKFGKLWRSSQGCGDGASAQSGGYLDTLVVSAAARTTDDDLELLDKDGEVLLRFAPSGPVDPHGEWAVLATTDANGSLAEVTDADSMTATFGPTGSLRGSTPCSNFRGGYSVQGSTISVGPVVTPMNSCDEAVALAAAAYLSALEAVASWSLGEGLLELRDASDQVVLQLRTLTADDG